MTNPVQALSSNIPPLPNKGRILCVTSNYPRWSGDSTTPFVLHLASDLQSLGWTVDVLAPHAEEGTADEEVISGVRVTRFHYLWPRRSQTVCYHGGALVNLRSNPLNALKLPMLVFFQWIAIVRQLRTGHYDLMHSHWILPQGFTGALAALLFSKPHVITVHGGDVFALKGKVLNAFKRFSLRKANAISVNSSVTQRAVESLVPEANQTTIPMGVDANSSDKDDEQVRQLRNRFVDGESPLLVFLGRLVDEKGVEDYIYAVDELRRQIPALRALVIGEGQDRDRFEALAKQLGLDGVVHFTGWVDPGEVSDYLAAADVFVGPSRQGSDGWIEAQGLTFIEAMMNNTPVVATRCGGIVDTVEHEVTGLLVDERSPKGLAHAVTRILKDQDLAKRLVEAANHRVNQRFTREASAKAFSNLFEVLCAKDIAKDVAKENGV